MSATASLDSGEDAHGADDRVILYNVSWLQYETMLDWRGDKAVPRYAYLDGMLEILRPSYDHERVKSILRSIVEAYAAVTGVEFVGVGSWTLRDPELARGLEPDECYIVGDLDKPRPDLAIEVMWKSGGLDKLEIYRGLAIPEVWVIRKGVITVHVLEGDTYTTVPRSQAFPKLDLKLVMELVRERSTGSAIRKMTAWAQEQLRRGE